MTANTFQASKASQQGSNPNNKFQVMYIGTSQKITTSGTSQQSSAVGSKCSLVRLYCTADCYVAIGANPTASSSTLFLPASTVEYFGCSGSDKVAVIQSTAAGSFYMTEGDA